MENSRKRIKILLIQPENPRIHKFRKWQFNNFAQITMPYLAAYINIGQYDVRIIDEYNQKIPYNESFRLIALTVNTANANHCYRISSRFRAKGTSIVGIDGVTASILSPLPGSKIYEKLKAENRLITDDWSYYDSKTNVAFVPKNMSAEQLYNGYMEFRKRFYSFSSFIKRMNVSKCRIFYNFMINLGYRLAIKEMPRI
jgi:hypothetical protein